MAKKTCDLYTFTKEDGSCIKVCRVNATGGELYRLEGWPNAYMERNPDCVKLEEVSLVRLVDGEDLRWDFTGDG